jgi:hypothetical protein
MNDDVAKVDQHPFADLFAFAREDAAAGFAHLVLDVAGQRLDLTVRVAAGDDDAVEERGQAAGVDDLDIAALDVFERVYDEFFQLGEFHWRVSSPGRGGACDVSDDRVGQQIARAGAAGQQGTNLCRRDRQLGHGKGDDASRLATRRAAPAGRRSGRTSRPPAPRAGRRQSIGKPGRWAMAICASSNSDCQRCQAGRPAKASAPTSRTSGRCGPHASARRRRSSVCTV